MLSWMNRDGKILLLARVTRGAGYGFLSVVLALGFRRNKRGIMLTATLVSSAVFTTLAGILERKIGRRSLLALLMSVAASVFIVSTNYLALLFAALIGTINVTGTEVGPFLSVEQAVIPNTCDQERRTLAFARYSVGGTLATSAGALTAGLPALLQSRGFALLDSFKPLFGLYLLIEIIILLLYLVLSDKVESSSPQPNSLLSPESKRTVVKLSGLFATAPV